MIEKFTIKNESFQELSERMLARARAFDRKEQVPGEFILSFERMELMARIFTIKRTELLRELAANGHMSLIDLASELKRARTAVARDVEALREHGLVETELVVNPGHGRICMVKPLARRYEFVWSIGAPLRKVAEKKSSPKKVKRKAA